MRITLLILIISFQTATAQSFSWIKMQEITLPKNTAYWEVDGLGNYYFIEQQQIEKFNSQGLASYQMSLKKTGEINKIVHVNALKTIVFSEVQQQVCILDNTLTNNGNCIQMENLNLQNILLISNSNRPNLVWLYDEYNSGLHLYDYVNNKIIQSVSNLARLVGLSTIEQIIEIESVLYVHDEKGKFVLFDLFMNQTISFTLPIRQVRAWKNHLVGIRGDQLNAFTLKGEEAFTIQLPINSSELVTDGEYFYFKNQNKINKYQLKIE